MTFAVQNNRAYQNIFDCGMKPVTGPFPCSPSFAPEIRRMLGDPLQFTDMSGTGAYSKTGWVFENAAEGFGECLFVFWYKVNAGEENFWVSIFHASDGSITSTMDKLFASFLTQLIENSKGKLAVIAGEPKNYFSVVTRGERRAEIRFETSPKLENKIISDVKDLAFMYDVKVKIDRGTHRVMVEAEGKTDYGVEKICNLIKSKL